MHTMAPNSIKNPTTTTTRTLMPAAKKMVKKPKTVPSSSVTYVQCKNMQYNVIIIGWLGVIISSAVLTTSLLSMHLQPEIQQLIKDMFYDSITKTQQQMLTNLLAVFSTALYALSLINTVVNLLLLIGVARECSSLLYPWLLFHGLLFGIGLYVGIFYLAAGMFVDLSNFVLILLVFALIMLIFYKTYHEVFTLMRVLSNHHLGAPYYHDVEHAYRTLSPYPAMYLPQVPQMAM